MVKKFSIGISESIDATMSTTSVSGSLLAIERTHSTARLKAVDAQLHSVNISVSATTMYAKKSDSRSHPMNGMRPNSVFTTPKTTAIMITSESLDLTSPHAWLRL